MIKLIPKVIKKGTMLYKSKTTKATKIATDMAIVKA